MSRGRGAGCAIDSHWSRGKRIVSEVEFLVEYCVTSVRCFHVGGREWNGDVEIQVEAEYGASDQDDKDGESGVFKICDLNLHRPEFDAPAGVLVVWWRLEAHVLPIR